MKGNLTTISRSTGIFAAGLSLAVVSSGWWSWHEAEEAQRAERRLGMRMTQWRGVVASEPTPTAEVAGALASQVEEARKVVRSWHARLGGTAPDPVYAHPVPEQRADAFFALAQFVEEQRTKAQRAAVEIRDHETFSFSAHRNSGPADEHLGLVHRQVVVVGRLLDALWKVRPVELIQVQRENPQQKNPLANAARTGSREGSPEDWMSWPDTRDLGEEGMVDSLAFQIGFVGRTATLRGYLAELSEESVPLVVRSVQVASLGADGRARRGRRTLDDLFRDEGEPGSSGHDQSDATVPIIPSNNAEFTVVVEYLDFVGPRQRLRGFVPEEISP